MENISELKHQFDSNKHEISWLHDQCFNEIYPRLLNEVSISPHYNIVRCIDLLLKLSKTNVKVIVKKASLLLNDKSSFARLQGVMILHKLSAEKLIKLKKSHLILLADTDPEVRISVAMLLGTAFNELEIVTQCMAVLLPLLNHQHWIIKTKAASTLLLLSQESEYVLPVVNACLPLLHDPNFLIRQHSRQILNKVSFSSEALMMIQADCIFLLQTGTLQIKISAAELLLEMFPNLENFNSIFEALLPNLSTLTSLNSREIIEQFSFEIEALHVLKKMQDLLPHLQSSMNSNKSDASTIQMKLSIFFDILNHLIKIGMSFLILEKNQYSEVALDFLLKLPHTAESATTVINALLLHLNVQNEPIKVKTIKLIGTLPLSDQNKKQVVQQFSTLLIPPKPASKWRSFQNALWETIIYYLPNLKNDAWLIQVNLVNVLLKISPTPEICIKSLNSLLPFIKDTDQNVRSNLLETIGRIPYSKESLHDSLKEIIKLDLQEDLFLIAQFLTDISCSNVSMSSENYSFPNCCDKKSDSETENSTYPLLLFDFKGADSPLNSVSNPFAGSNIVSVSLTKSTRKNKLYFES